MDLSKRYYQLITDIYNFLHNEIEGLKFESVELYSNTGYPLAVSPDKYLQRISQWYLEPNTMVYVYPKNIPLKEKSPEKKYSYSIDITIESTDIILSVMLCHVKLFCQELKAILSLQHHIPIKAILLQLLYVDTNIMENPPDTCEIEMKLVINKEVLISIQILATDESYLVAFNTDIYKSCVPHNATDWNNFNCLLLYLAKEQLKEDKSNLLAKLGLLRRISRSPPLVYALYRLLTGAILYLPHRVAINEGIITTLSFLITDREPGIRDFPALWLYLEQNTKQEHIRTEVYKTLFVTKHTRDRPRDAETKRLLQAFPPKEDSIITWSDCPSAHELLSYRRLNESCFFLNKLHQRFTLHHPIELYNQYLVSGIDYGISKSLISDQNTYWIFLGPIKGMYGYFEFFNPQKGESISCNPHDIITSYSLPIENQLRVNHILIVILDISTDMDQKYGEHVIGRGKNENKLVSSPLAMSIRIIELLIDKLIGIGSVYLFGVILISNSHSYHDKFKDGIFWLQNPTFEYVKTLKTLEEFIKKHPPHQSNSQTKIYPQGILVNALLKLLDYFQSNKIWKFKVFLLENNLSNSKYNGSKVYSLAQKMIQFRFAINILNLSQERSEELYALCKSTKGEYLDQSDISQQAIQFFIENNPDYYLFGFYLLFEDILNPLEPHDNYQNYDIISRSFKKKLTNIYTILKNVQIEKDKSIESSATTKQKIQIIRQISGYSKSPNPYCKLFSINGYIHLWLCIIQGPDDTPYQNSLLFLEISFGINYPQKPPKFRFLSSYYHPNIRLTGEVCHPIIFEDYHPRVSLGQMLDSIYEMICSPVLSHGVRYEVMEIFLFHKKIFLNNVESFLNLNGFKRSILDCLKDFCVLNITKPTFLEPYLCPLTGELFDQPVLTPEGNTYERHAILLHLKHHDYDPTTCPANGSRPNTQ